MYLDISFKRRVFHFSIDFLNFEFSMGKIKIDKKFWICAGKIWNGPIGLENKRKKAMRKIK